MSLKIDYINIEKQISSKKPVGVMSFLRFPSARVVKIENENFTKFVG